MVYGGEPTALCRWARAARRAGVDGLEMLVRQGARSFERWTGRPAPLDAMRAGRSWRLNPTRARCRYRWQWRSPARSSSLSSEPSCSAPRRSPCRTPATRLRQDAAPAAVQSEPAPTGTDAAARLDAGRRRSSRPSTSGERRERASSPPSCACRPQRPPVREVSPRRRLRDAARPGTTCPTSTFTAASRRRRQAVDRRLRVARRQGVLHPRATPAGACRQRSGARSSDAAASGAPQAQRCPSRSTPRPGCATSSPRAPTRSPASRPTTSPRPSTRRPSSRTCPQAAEARTAPTLPGSPASRRPLVKRAELDVWVGGDDHILRRLIAEVASRPAGARRRSTLRLSDVNEPQQIEAPAHVRAGAPGRLGSSARASRAASSGRDRREPARSRP